MTSKNRSALPTDELERVFAADPPVTRADALRPVSRETSLPLDDSAQRAARVVAIANQKGGVGKTTTAVNLAACLAAAEKRTLLIDLDPQGNASSGLGVAKETLRRSIYDVLLNEMPLAEVIVPTPIGYLDLAPATVDLFGAEVELVSAIGREHRLEAALEGHHERYDFIFVDCPPSLGLQTVNALVAADAAVIPLQCEYFALEGLAQLMKTLGLVRDRANPRLEVEGIVFTMFVGRTTLALQVRAEVEQYFRVPLVRT
jgi:chromosome partitioning protein